MQQKKGEAWKRLSALVYSALSAGSTCIRHCVDPLITEGSPPNTPESWNTSTTCVQKKHCRQKPSSFLTRLAALTTSAAAAGCILPICDGILGALLWPPVFPDTLSNLPRPWSPHHLTTNLSQLESTKKFSFRLFSFSIELDGCIVLGGP